MKLAPKLTILFFLLAIVPTAIVGYLTYENGRQTIMKETIHHLVSINIFKGNELKRWVEDNETSIEELAQRPLVNQYAEVLAKHDTPDHTYHMAKGSIVKDHFRPRLKYGGFFELFLMCPRHGLISASTNEKQEGKHRDTYPYFIEGKNRTYIQGIYYSTVLEQPAITISTPIKDKQGNLMGVLGGRLDLEELSKIITLHSGKSPEEDTYLVNAFNFFVTEPRFGQGYALKKAVRTEGVEAALSGKDGVGFYKDYRGVPVIGAYKWLPEFKVCIITEINKAEAFYPIVRLAWVVTGIVSVISIVSGLLGLFFARTITRPVRQLAAGAEKIGGGYLEYRVGTASMDEIGGLSRAFDRMTENLKATMVSRDELAKSEERFRIAAASASDLIWDWDISSGRLDWFGKIDEMLGYGSDEFPRTIEAWEKAIHPDDIACVNATLDRHLKEGTPYDEEYRIKRKDGNYLSWIDRGTALRDENGQPYRMIGACTNITERKRAEEALRSSEEKYRTILETIEEGYYEVDITGNFTLFNDSLCRMLGYTKDELMGINNRQYMDKETAKKVFQVFNQLYTTGEPYKTFDWEIIRKDGTKRFHDSSVSLIRNEKGEGIGFRGIARDVTERKQAEEALSESEERFRELYDNAPVGYFEYDSQGRITSVNRTELEMLGYTAEEMIGQPLWKFIVGEETVRQQILGKIAGIIPSARGLERTYRRKDGTLLPVLIEDRLLRNTGGSITGIRSTIQDITDRKRSEEEKAALQEQLRQSQKMEAIGQLAGGVAHDFNNILTVIKGYSQLSLAEMREGEPLRKNIEEIKKSADRAADLTRQLLAFSRRQVMEMRVLDLNDLLRNLDKMLHRVIGEDIELATILDQNLGRVKTDPGQIEQVIMNLAVNARDAMFKGGKLTIETANVELDQAYTRSHVAVTPGHYVMISVSDTGVGMPPEIRDRIFEPFFTTKEKGRGTGLGLSTVYGIVKQSGGNIWVYSELGKGTTFKVYLPRVDGPFEELKEKLIKEELPRGNETILIVEDEEDVLKLAGRILSRQGYHVLEASGGEEALRICKKKKEPFHLLLTDVVMPQMSGRELIEKCRQMRADFKTLYMSGYTDDIITHHGILQKGLDYIQKPFTVDGLARKVREVLDK